MIKRWLHCKYKLKSGSNHYAEDKIELLLLTLKNYLRSGNAVKGDSISSGTYK